MPTLSIKWNPNIMYNVKRLNGKFSNDTFYPSTKSIHGNMCAQIFSNKLRFVACYHPPNAKGDIFEK